MTPSGPAQRIAAVRRFNRFYTKQIGLLEEGLLDSPFSLTQVRVLYELAHRPPTTATAISRELAMDAGYLSRILSSFRRKGLVRREAAPADRRQGLLTLTRKGKTTLAPLESASDRRVARMLEDLSEAGQGRLAASMGAIESLLNERTKAPAPLTLRAHRPGDMGWIVYRHGALYAAEYGWDERFEALVAGIAARFIENFDPRRERCWIAEQDGEIVGSVFLVRKSRRVAKLRMLYVEPRARGLGIGRRLVEECLSFARAAGYTKIVLWTQSVLVAARRIYEQAGFHLVARERHSSFGHRLVAEIWERELTDTSVL